MYTVSQWLHQHDFLLLCAAACGGMGLLLVLRRRSRRMWLLWLVVTGSCLAALNGLRSPPASVSEHLEPEWASLFGGEHDTRVASVAYGETELASVAAIERLIAGGGKPTLVEVYADFGLS